MNMYTKKKSYYYDFLPSKAVEEAAVARGMPYQATRILVELTDIYPPTKIEPTNPWLIRRCVTTNEVLTGKIMVPHHIVFEYVFRYWDMDLCNHVIAGHKSYMTIVDYTEEDAPKRFQGHNIFLEAGASDTFFLGWMDLVRSRVVCPGDEVGLFYEKASGFGFKLLRRGKPVQID